MQTQRSNRPRWLAGVVLGLACLVAGPGCQQEMATVTGTVTSRGKVVTTGYVVFHTTDGRTTYGAIGRDGVYSVPNVPPGEVRVVIGGMLDAMPGGTTPAAGAPPLPGTKDRPPVPAKYFHPDTSGLKYTIEPGRQRIDLPAD